MEIKKQPQTADTTDISSSISDVNCEEYDAAELPQLLKIYYSQLFPAQQFYDWFAYGSADTFLRREFSFTLTGDIYLRYLSFSSVDDLRRDLCQKLPEKIDIGGLYSICPRDAKRDALPNFPLERELVFDIDMTDYDDVRSCCDGAKICPKCWTFMQIAAKILHRALTQDFGFKHLLWIYSGRRGLHCWVSDERARKLSFEARDAIVRYLTVIEGGDQRKKKVQFDYRRPLNHSITQALIIVNSYFEKLVNEQRMFDGPSNIQRLVNLCETADLHKEIKQILLNTRFKNSFDAWNHLVRLNQKNTGKGRHLLEEIKLQFCYPRLDINVSKHLNHLLKAPFSVHPKTGRICVPIDISNIDEFDPFSVTRIHDLCTELGKYDACKANAPDIKPYEKTSLKESINLFKNAIMELNKERISAKQARNDIKLEF